MTVGQQIRGAREQAGMSQELLARLAGTSTRTIVRLENDQHHARPQTLRRIALALGKAPDFFVAPTTDPLLGCQVSKGGKPFLESFAAYFRRERKRQSADPHYRDVA